MNVCWYIDGCAICMGLRNQCIGRREERAGKGTKGVLFKRRGSRQLSSRSSSTQCKISTLIDWRVNIGEGDCERRIQSAFAERGRCCSVVYVFLGESIDCMGLGRGEIPEVYQDF